MMSQLSRDEFVSLLIHELQRQKSLSEHPDQFFTGVGMKDLPTVQIFRKLCYDYPLVTNYDLRAFVTDIKLLRENSLSTVSEESVFFQYFNLNNQFLQNLHYFVFHEEILEDTSNQYVEDSRKEIVGQLLVEIYLEYPLFLTRLSQSRLSKILHPTTSRIFALELDTDNKVKGKDDTTVFYGWDELLEYFRLVLLTGSSSLLVTGLKHPKVRQNLSFQSILQFLQFLKDIILNHNQNFDGKASKVRSIGQYLQKLDLSLLESDHETHVTIYTTIKEILAHYVFMINDLLCQYPELFPTIFPQLATILLDPVTDSFSSSLSPLTTDIAIEAKIFGNYHLLLLLKNIATFIHNEEQFLLTHPKTNKSNRQSDTSVLATNTASTPPPTVTPITSTMDITTLKAIKETIRKFFITDHHLSLIVSFLETCYPTKYKKSDSLQKSSLTSYSIEMHMITNKEIEIYEYYLFIGELLFGGIRLVSSLSKVVYQQVVSSRLLWHLLSHYYQLLKIYLSLQTVSNLSSEQNGMINLDYQRILQEYSSSLWDYSIRLTKLLTTGILRDEGILQFIISTPETGRIWTDIHALYQNASYLASRHQSYSQWMLWEIPLGISFSYTCLLRSSDPTISMNTFWETFISTGQMIVLQDLAVLQTSEYLQQLTIPVEEGEDEAASEIIDNNEQVVTEAMIQAVQRQKQLRERFHEKKQFYSKCLESLQTMCQLLNQDEFALIRSLKGRQDPQIERIFHNMRGFIVEVGIKLRNLRNQLQLHQVNDWRLESLDRTMKLVKSLQSSLDGNTSNKTD